MARRSKPYELQWPPTAVQWSNINTMFRLLFDDTNNGTLTVRTGQLSGVIDVEQGGTGLDSYVIGDLLYASATDELSTLAAVATGKVLTSAGVATAPAWAQVDLTTMVTGTLPATNGGTGFASYTIGDLLYASSTTALSKLAAVATGSYLRAAGAGAAPVWSTLLLPNAATTGDIPQATATNSLAMLAGVAAGSYLRSGGVGTANVWSTVKIPNTANTGDLWQATASNSLAALASVAAGSYLRSAGVTTANVWSTLTLPNASAQGDLFYSTAANAMTVLNKNASATRYLSNTGTNNDPAWAQVNLANGVTGTLPVGNGGTGLTTFAQGDLIYGSAANVLSALTKDANATRYLSNTGASNNPAWAQIDLSNGVTGDLPFANLTQGSALSVLGVTGNATADFASIAAASDGQTLRRSGTTLAFGALDLSNVNAITGDLPFANLAQGSALSVLGVTGNATADNASIVAASDGQVLRRSGTSVGFGALDLASANAITGDLPFANLTQGSALSVLGVAGNATADNASIAAASDNQVLRRSGTSIGFGSLDLTQAATATAAGSSYTPTLTDITIGNGSVSGTKVQVGKIVHWTVTITFGTTTTLGALPRFTVPTAAVSSNAAQASVSGYGNDSSAVTSYELRVVDVDASTLLIVYGNPNAPISTTAPFTWATGDTIVLGGSYIAA